MITLSGGAGNAGALRTLLSSDRALTSSFQKLSTGLRINRGADDPAGLIHSERLGAELARLDAESRSIERADAVAATAESALSQISGMLTDASALAVANASTGGLSRAEREANQMELDSILASVDRIASSASFGGSKLLDGSVTLQAGQASYTLDAVSTSGLGQVESGGETYNLSDAGSGGPISASGSNLGAAYESIRAAAESVGKILGSLGAFQRNAIGPELRSRAVALENIAAARSSVRDTDFAAEAAELARAGTINSAARAALAMANSAPERVVSLLG